MKRPVKRPVRCPVSLRLLATYGDEVVILVRSEVSQNMIEPQLFQINT